MRLSRLPSFFFGDEEVLSFGVFVSSFFLDNPLNMERDPFDPPTNSLLFELVPRFQLY